MLPEAADALYDLPVGEFTAARDALAKELRAAKDKEGANAVKALRKPTAAAAAVNRVVRTKREQVDALVAAGDRLRLAAAGNADSLREAMSARRKLVTALVDEALALDGVGASQRDPIASTFEAASLDVGCAALVLEGRLAKELEPPTGFGDDVVVGPARAREPAPETAEDEVEPDEPAGPDPRAIAMAQSEVKRREGAAERARAEADRAAYELERARRHLDHLELKAQRAASDAEEAEEELADAKAALDSLR